MMSSFPCCVLIIHPLYIHAVCISHSFYTVLCHPLFASVFSSIQGCEPSIRAEVWEFLLGVYHADSTRVERDALRDARR